MRTGSYYLQDMGLGHLWEKAYDENEQLRWGQDFVCSRNIGYSFHVTSESSIWPSNILISNGTHWTLRLS